MTAAAGRRAYGSGSLLTRTTSDGASVYYAKFRDSNDRQVKRRIGHARTPHRPDGLTKSQAEARLRDLMRTEQAQPVEQARTLRAATDEWLDHLANRGAKRSSVRAYRSAMDKWFLPTLGDMSLDRITTRHIEMAVSEMRADGKSSKTIRNYVTAIRALYSFAVADRQKWTRHNPAKDVDLPPAPEYHDIEFLTPAELWALYDNVPEGPYAPLDRAMYLTAGMTGMRVGELQALQWRNVDFIHGRVRVRRSWDRKDKTFTTPKSKKSERSIPLDDGVAGELERMFRHYHPDAKEPDPDALVFADPFTGEPCGWRGLYGRLRAALAAAGLTSTGCREYGFHTLRHSFGTAMAAQGVAIRSLQEWMGHESIDTTMRYAHYSPNEREREIVAAAFGRGTNSGTNLPEPTRT